MQSDYATIQRSEVPVASLPANNHLYTVMELTRTYEIYAFDSGDNPLTSGFVAEVTLCYSDIELPLASIASGEEGNLNAYPYQGAGACQEFSVVDTANNTVIANGVTELGTWGLGIVADKPPAVMQLTAQETSSLALLGQYRVK